METQDFPWIGKAKDIFKRYSISIPEYLKRENIGKYIPRGPTVFKWLNLETTKAGSENVKKIKDPGTAHKVASMEAKNPNVVNAAKPDGTKITDHDNLKETKPTTNKKTGKKTPKGKPHTTVNKPSVKNKTMSPPRKWDPKAMMQKARKSKWLSLGLAIGGTVVAMNFLNSFSDRTYGHLAPTAQRVGLWSREGTYIPEKYARGYDTIKQSLTDFGSRVNLSKTAMKVNVTPPSSTRNGMIRTTGSVTRSNIALRAHSNAINHTRY